jgi:hypothetical protein
VEGSGQKGLHPGLFISGFDSRGHGLIPLNDHRRYPAAVTQHQRSLLASSTRPFLSPTACSVQRCRNLYLTLIFVPIRRTNGRFHPAYTTATSSPATSSLSLRRRATGVKPTPSFFHRHIPTADQPSESLPTTPTCWFSTTPNTCCCAISLSTNATAHTPKCHLACSHCGRFAGQPPLERCNFVSRRKYLHQRAARGEQCARRESSKRQSGEMMRSGAAWNGRRSM